MTYASLSRSHVANTAPIVRRRIAQLLDKKAGINQTTLAGWAGVARSHMSAVLKGKRDLGRKALDRLAERSGRPVAWFVEENGPDLLGHTHSDKKTPPAKEGVDGSSHTETRLLRERIRQLEAENKALRGALIRAGIAADRLLHIVKPTR